MSQVPSSESSLPALDHHISAFHPRQTTRIAIGALILLCCIAFTYAGKWIGWPSELRFEGSLTYPHFAFGAIVTAMVLLAVCAVVATLVVQRLFYMGGLLAATAGLTVWAARGGSATYVLFDAHNTGEGRRVFLRLVLELVILYGGIALLWDWIWRAFNPVLKLKMAETKSNGENSPSVLTAVAVQTLVTFVLVLIFVATPLKKQALAGVFFASMFGTALAEMYFGGITTSRWYWAGPLVAGLVGYLLNLVTAGGFEIGDVSGTFAPLGRVLPLDYASLGAAGALMGMWWMTREESGPGGARDLAEP